ncbi:PKD domain-containing protein [Natrinema salaciae]|uniref:PKD domain-containing protein n=1 Tax=Natrinema salaciae TaxID=1186196 RepID=A0A1H9GXU0_9EURY|nr:PKD domain-containing protein [Natrinema salaciae]SEQ54932.1 PKD domain-containing protein [Natrinema salaciae]
MTGSCALASASLAGAAGVAAQSDEETVSRESFAIRKGTAEETTVYVTTADADGPTAVVVGGLHGNEVAGYTAADRIADWTIDAGTLVTIPETNAVAIERGTRNDENGNNLNRQFPEGMKPQTELARALWNVVTEYDPDIFIDLHESTGVYAGDTSDGVGQAIFHSDGAAATDAAADAADYVTQAHIDDPDLAFQIGPFSSPSADPKGLFAHKAARDLGAESFLAETVSKPALGTRVQWHTTVVDRLFQGELLRNGASTSTQEADPDESAEESTDSDAGDSSTTSPNAQIQLLPTWSSESTLDPGQTVTLDASRSRDPDGEIVRYEWCVGDSDSFEETGETIEVTVDSNGEHPVELRVVDDDGSTGTDRITLSAGC